ncbi:hypothetical protein F4778DRAFT_782381 [Xylariomycetidae sp. FL2044]|nr:hypothetical protein F4778DRAFT_782381 [Xylariomycetidae sp. FL2044]
MASVAVRKEHSPSKGRPTIRANIRASAETPAPSRPNTTLDLIALFMALFAAAIAIMTNARPAEVFGACTAFTAVLAFSVSGDFAGSASAGG